MLHGNFAPGAVDCDPGIDRNFAVSVGLLRAQDEMNSESVVAFHCNFFLRDQSLSARLQNIKNELKSTSDEAFGLTGELKGKLAFQFTV